MAQKGIIRNSTVADVSAENMAAAFHAVIGSSGILNRFNNLACTKLTDNSVRLDSGVYSLRGFLLHVEPGTAVNLAIDSGTAGQKRNDLIVAELVKGGGGTGNDTLNFKVVKGASTSGSPVDPQLTQQDINANGTTCQESIYRVKLDGISIISIELVSGYVGNLSSAVVESGGSNAAGFYKKFADGTLEAYGRKPLFLNVTTAYGSLFRTEMPTYITYPKGAVFDLTNCIPVVTVSAKDALIQRYNDSTPNDFGIYAIKPISSVNQSLTFEWQAKGRWKP
jgi:hypothetical protein